MSKRSYESDSQTSQELSQQYSQCNVSSRAGQHSIVIDHTREYDYANHQKLLRNKSLSDTSTDIRFIVDNEEIAAHREVIEILKDKRQLVRDAIERDKKMAKMENSDEANVFQMSGTTVSAFRCLLQYIYTGKVVCEPTTGIELATTAYKLKFHPLVASLAQQLAHQKNCLNLETVDDLYHIGKCAKNGQLLKICTKFMDSKAYDLNSMFLRRDTKASDGPNVLVYAYDRSRYSNYVHFLIPDNIEICFNVSVSSDRTNWTVVLKNDEIWSKFWNWVYFEEKRIKYIRIVFTDQKDGQHFDVRDLRDDNFLCKRANIELEFDRTTNYLIPTHDVIKFPIRETKFYFDEKQEIFTYCMSTASVKDKENHYFYHCVNDDLFLEFYLAQTCLIDNFRLRLWDLDPPPQQIRRYDFSVEIKNEEEEDWTLIKDDKHSRFRDKSSWVTVDLRGRKAVRWIKITGLKGPAHDPEFAIIDFECPAQTSHKTK